MIKKIREATDQNWARSDAIGTVNLRCDVCGERCIGITRLNGKVIWHLCDSHFKEYPELLYRNNGVVPWDGPYVTVDEYDWACQSEHLDMVVISDLAAARIGEPVAECPCGLAFADTVRYEAWKAGRRDAHFLPGPYSGTGKEILDRSPAG